jgi:hypothetical protein
MRMMETITEPQITAPMEPQDFSKLITIRWDPMDTPNVTEWWLCHLDRELTIDVSGQSNLMEITVQLLCTVTYDDEFGTSERTMVLEPVAIRNINHKYSTYTM